MMIVVATITAVSVTRTITDTGDSVETFIKNSNGNYWSVSEANIQAAINDLGASGWKNGIVWIPGNKEIIINTGIVLKKYVTLDLQGSYLDVRSNVDGVTMAEGSVLRGERLIRETMLEYIQKLLLLLIQQQWVTIIGQEIQEYKTCFF